MLKAIKYLTMCLLLVLFSCSSPGDESDEQNAGNTQTVATGHDIDNSDMVDKIKASVVTIYAGSSQGSGVFVASDKVVTNHHVINKVREGETIILKQKSGSMFYASAILADDPANDLAVLQFQGTAMNIAEIGNSDNVKDGDEVYAVGSPQGLENSITGGMISNLKMEIKTETATIVGFQHSAPIDHGSSGGGLFNKKNGELIGINFAGSDEMKLTVGFAIPVNIIKPLLGLSTPKVKFKEDDAVKQQIIQKYKITQTDNIDGGKVHFLFSAIDSNLKRWVMFAAVFLLGYFTAYLWFRRGIKKSMSPSQRMSSSWIIICLFVIIALAFSFSDLVWSKSTTITPDATEEVIQ